MVDRMGVDYSAKGDQHETDRQLPDWLLDPFTPFRPTTPSSRRCTIPHSTRAHLRGVRLRADDECAIMRRMSSNEVIDER